MGILWLILLAVVALGLLWVRGVRGGLFTVSAAVLAFAGAGYALQGSPGQAGSPRAIADRPVPPSLNAARTVLMGRFDNSDGWLTMSEALASRGNTKDAAGLLQSAVRQHPTDFKLWVGLGNALADHSRTLSPAARFAFERARALGPAQPAPPFFLGLAAARSGDPETARREWQGILANAPANASWRPLVEDALLTLPPQPATNPVRRPDPSSTEASR
ncbi:tetratricopeptide repeat protein [Sphingomonas sp. LY160]|uniref:tetratricopeptide repeat protein n=1 Tax=Sphingomonas sp. LY160 TaxID=3095342 RepID=UPI002ADEED52|nr:tetratricopeptide repeat protein [Sphingomonas sp. LY160]MEA1071096.1 tetratricopeptide repeat protein [Sphingomonas sp. LY160]